MSFSEIACQDRAIRSLFQAFASHKTAHTYIFSGPEGVGKFKTASQWARLLLCPEPVTSQSDNIGLAYESCGTCHSCRLWDGDTHPDFFHVHKELRQFTADGKGKAAPVDMPVDVIREFLIAKVGTRPTVSNYKVFVVSEAQKLNTASQNALLKVLEEPPVYCCIILLCTRLEKLLPTTKSRAQIIRFGPVNEEYIVEHLRDFGWDEGKSLYFARLSQGSLGLAVEWARLEETGADFYGIQREIVEQLADLNKAECLLLAEHLQDKAKQILASWIGLDTTTSRTDLSRRALKTVIQMITSVYEDVMKLPLQANVPLIIIHSQQIDLIRNMAEEVSSEAAADKISDCFTALRWIEAGVNERLILERLLLRLAGSDIMQSL